MKTEPFRQWYAIVNPERIKALQKIKRINLVIYLPIQQSGEDIKLSHSARKKFPFSVECKAQEKLNIWESLKQAEDNSNDYTPLLIFKRNRSKTYVTLSLEDFLDLL